MTTKVGKYNIGKECGGRWFPGIGYGRWDGLRWFLKHQKPKINLKFRKFDTNHSNGIAFGPLMLWWDK